MVEIHGSTSFFLWLLTLFLQIPKSSNYEKVNLTWKHINSTMFPMECKIFIPYILLLLIMNVSTKLNQNFEEQNDGWA